MTLSDNFLLFLYFPSIFPRLHIMLPFHWDSDIHVYINGSFAILVRKTCGAWGVSGCLSDRGLLSSALFTGLGRGFSWSGTDGGHRWASVGFTFRDRYFMFSRYWGGGEGTGFGFRLIGLFALPELSGVAPCLSLWPTGPADLVRITMSEYG